MFRLSLKIFPYDSNWRKIGSTAPYGIRESTYKVGSKKIAPIPDETHFPSKTQYGLGDIYKDLLNFAANSLKLHGRLVLWIPIIR
jgi:tRNA (guanine10-N2)-methyltransferase